MTMIGHHIVQAVNDGPTYDELDVGDVDSDDDDSFDGSLCVIVVIVVRALTYDASVNDVAEIVAYAALRVD